MQIVHEAAIGFLRRCGRATAARSSASATGSRSSKALTSDQARSSRRCTRPAPAAAPPQQCALRRAAPVRRDDAARSAAGTPAGDCPAHRRRGHLQPRQLRRRGGAGAEGGREYLHDRPADAADVAAPDGSPRSVRVSEYSLKTLAQETGCRSVLPGADRASCRACTPRLRRNSSSQYLARLLADERARDGRFRASSCGWSTVRSCSRARAPATPPTAAASLDSIRR